MPPVSHPLRFLLVAVAGWIHQQQRDVIDYLRAENRELREQLGPKRVRFTNDHSHWDVLAAADFFTVEVWTGAGLTRFAVLFVIELATRRVEIAGIVAEPDSAWVTQCGRRVTEAGDGCLLGKRFLLHDRDPPFFEAFRETLAAVRVQTVRPSASCGRSKNPA